MTSCARAPVPDDVIDPLGIPSTRRRANDACRCGEAPARAREAEVHRTPASGWPAGQKRARRYLRRFRLLDRSDRPAHRGSAGSQKPYPCRYFADASGGGGIRTLHGPIRPITVFETTHDRLHDNRTRGSFCCARDPRLDQRTSGRTPGLSIPLGWSSFLTFPAAGRASLWPLPRFGVQPGASHEVRLDLAVAVSFWRDRCSPAAPPSGRGQLGTPLPRRVIVSPSRLLDDLAQHVAVGVLVALVATRASPP